MSAKFDLRRKMKYMKEKPEGPFFSSIIKFNNFKNIVEVGVAYGGTTRYLCSAAKYTGGHVYGFDTWEQHGLEEQYKQKSSLKEVSTNLKIDNNHNFTLFKINTRLESDRFRDILDSKCPIIDFAFIDGCHSYDGLKNDFELVYPKMAKHGVVVFHDSLRIDGCREFVLDLRTKFNDGTFDVVDFPWGNNECRVGVTMLVKRTWPILGMGITEVCGSPSTKEEIYKREKDWYNDQLNRAGK